jgi:hypothetical protein
MVGTHPLVLDAGDRFCMVLEEEDFWWRKSASGEF